jgi:hypothetical protein
LGRASVRDRRGVFLAGDYCAREENLSFQCEQPIRFDVYSHYKRIVPQQTVDWVILRSFWFVDIGTSRVGTE